MQPGTVKKIPAGKDDSVGTVHLNLLPKKGSSFARQFKSIDVWVDAKSHFPSRIETLDNNQTTIANAAESTIELKEIEKAIYNLPEIFKTPFTLYFEGYKYHEITDALHEPLGTIKSRIHFARKLLKTQINRF